MINQLIQLPSPEDALTGNHPNLPPAHLEFSILDPKNILTPDKILLLELMEATGKRVHELVALTPQRIAYHEVLYFVQTHVQWGSPKEYESAVASLHERLKPYINEITEDAIKQREFFVTRTKECLVQISEPALPNDPIRAATKLAYDSITKSNHTPGHVAIFVDGEKTIIATNNTTESLVIQHASDLLYTAYTQKLVQDTLSPLATAAFLEKRLTPLTLYGNNERETFIITGGPGSGKTTFVPRILMKLADDGKNPADIGKPAYDILKPLFLDPNSLTDDEKIFFGRLAGGECRLAFQNILNRLECMTHDNAAPDLIIDNSHITAQRTNIGTYGDARVRYLVMQLPVEIALQRAMLRAQNGAENGVPRFQDSANSAMEHKVNAAAFFDMLPTLKGKNVMIEMGRNDVPRNASPTLVMAGNMKNSELFILDFEGLMQFWQKSKMRLPAPGQQIDMDKLYNPHDKTPEANADIVVKLGDQMNLYFVHPETLEVYATYTHSSNPPLQILNTAALNETLEHSSYARAALTALQPNLSERKHTLALATERTQKSFEKSQFFIGGA